MSHKPYKTRKTKLIWGIIFSTIGWFFTTTQAVENPLDPKIEAKISDIINQLSLEEKVALFHGNSLFTSAGVERLGIPELKMTDGPFGIREELQRNSWAPVGATNDSATFFPTGPALAATWNVDLAYQYGQALGAEARARGKDVLLGPAINIMRTPLCGRNFDYLTEDPFLNARLAVQFVNGVQSQDVAACVKHFAMNNQETERGSISVEADERTIREIYLPAFEATVKEAGALAMMGSYNKFRGFYLCENDYLLNQVLKNEWGFPGVVISDWGATHSTVASALGGLDIEMGSFGGNSFMGKALLDSVQAGKVPMAVIDEKAKRVLRVLLTVNKPAGERATGALATPEHSKIVYDVAAEAVILLKNSANVLPLDAGAIKNLLVLGDNADQIQATGGFGAGVKTKYEITPLAGLRKKLGDKVNITVAPGYKKQFKPRQGRQFFPEAINTPDSTLLAEAVAAAKSADAVVIFAGSNRQYESEARDRADLSLPFGQVELIEAVTAVNPKTAVVIIAGAAFDLNRVAKATSALLWAGFNGSEAGNAFADVIFGDANPSGKLPFTIPVKLEDVGPHALGIFPGENGIAEYSDGILAGYRWFDAKNIAPEFCFGYGLSYTTFDYSAIKTNKSTYSPDDVIDVTVTLKNTGVRAGAETVQLYVHDKESSVEKAVKELKGFAKVYVEPGKTQKVQVKVKAKDLAYYDQDNKKWVVEPGEYELLAGSSSRDIRQTATIKIE